jgi:GT2 family glycosyltransferase
MQAAVIIPVTRPKSLYLCMQGLMRQTFPHDQFEIILIKDSDMILELENADIKITQIKEDILLPTFRRNLGVKKTDANILAFLGDDTLPPVGWLQNAIWHIEEEKIDGASGPFLHLQNNLSLGSRLANATRESFFLEGDEICNIHEKKLVKFYNIPLCNVVIKREVWDSVGGFNEVVANYHMDDCEFFYLANKRGYKFYNIPQIAVQHAIESFPLGYLKKKFTTRFYTGVNAAIFNEIYREIPVIRLGFLVYPFIIIVFLLVINNWFNMAVFLIIYFGLAIWFSRKTFTKNKKVFILLPIVFFLTHLTIFIAFTSGILYFLMKKKSFQVIIENKKIRLKKCLNAV